MKTKQSEKSSVPAIAREGERALKAAVAEVVAEHKKAGMPLAVWHEGKAVMIAPEKAASVVRERHANYRIKRKR